MKNNYLFGAMNLLFFCFSAFILLLSCYLLEILSSPLFILLGILYILFSLGGFVIYLKGNSLLYNGMQFFFILCNVVSLFFLYQVEKEYSYYTNLYSKTYSYEDCALYVLKKTTTYSSLEKLNHKTIGCLSSYEKEISIHFKEYNYLYRVYPDISSLEEAIKGGEIQGIAILKKESDLFSSSIKKETRIIDTFKMKI